MNRVIADQPHRIEHIGGLVMQSPGYEQGNVFVERRPFTVEMNT